MDLHWFIRNSSQREHVFTYKVHWTRCVCCFAFFWSGQQPINPKIHRSYITGDGSHYKHLHQFQITVTETLFYTNINTYPIDNSSDISFIIILLFFIIILKSSRQWNRYLLYSWELYIRFPMTIQTSDVAFIFAIKF